MHWFRFFVLITSALLHFVVCVAEEQAKLGFTNINAHDGLSSSMANCVYQDHKGLLWVGTTKGLNTYDGIRIREWPFDATAKIKINNEYITCIYQVDSNRIFVGSASGLSVYNYSKDKFIHFFPNENNPLKTQKKGVTAIYKDQYQNIWIGTADGLCKYQEENQAVEFKHYRFVDNGESIDPGDITSINEDKNGMLWICTWKGLWFYNVKKDQVQKCEIEQFNADDNLLVRDAIVCLNGDFLLATSVGLYKITYIKEHFPKVTATNLLEGLSISQMGITSLCETSDKKIWIGTYLRGVFVVDFESSIPKCSNYMSLVYDKYSLAFNNVKDIFADRSGIVWIATSGGGISKYDKNQYLFSSIQLADLKNKNTTLTDVTGLTKDEHGVLWISFLGKGLYYLLPETGLVGQISDSRFKGSSLYSIKSDGNGILYAAMSQKEHSGLVRMKIPLEFYKKHNQNKIEIDVYQPKGLNPQIHRGIAVEIGQDGVVWYSCYNKGLYKFNFLKNTASPQVKHYPHPHNIRSIVDDGSGKVWIGSLQLYSFDKASEKFTKEAGWSCLALHKAKNGILWIGSNQNGLISFNAQTGETIFFKKDDGLPSNHIVSIQEDENENIWLGTLRGLSVLTSENHQFVNYSDEDGLLNFEFSTSDSYLGKDGIMYFGGTLGIDYFNPNTLLGPKTYTPNIVFTHLAIDGQEMHVGEAPNATLTENILNVKEIYVHPRHEQVAISFADLNFSNSDKRLYRYKLDPIEQNWYYTDATGAMVIYRNLKNGTYTLNVSSTNSEGSWQQRPATIKLIVLPEFYETIWFRLVMMVGIAGLVIFIYRYRIAQLKLQHTILEQKVCARTNDLTKANIQLEKQKEEILEQKEQVHQIKMNFFTNISHEFRTPITLIKGPLEQVVKSGFDANVMKKYLKVVEKNIDILMGLINEIMDFRKLETGHEDLSAQKIQLNSFLKNIIDAFSELAIRKEIHLEFISTGDYTLWGDKEKISKIMYNLISNAFKFTDKHGEVKIIVSNLALKPNPLLHNEFKILAGDKELENYIEIVVEDNGLGISKKSISEIFQRYYQVEDTFEHLGSGIGLALTKQLVLLHKGDIFVNSERGKGSRFTLRFPAGKEHLKPSDIVENKDSISLDSVVGLDTVTCESEILKATMTNQINTDLCILVIEDNKDLRDYLVDIFSKRYKVIAARDGVEGYEKAVSELPDLILSDVMMPGTSGTKLCLKIKSNINTCHIPVVLLTAYSSAHHKMHGLKKGADLYISKPFDTQMLELQIENIILTRSKIIQKIRKENKFIPEEISTNDMDLEFLDKITSIVQNNSTDSAFGVEKLSSEMCMSSKNMQRKLKALTGYTIADYMRRIKLNMAIELLETTDYPIAEVAFELGFYYSSQFSKNFKAKYGETTLEFRNKITK